MNQKSLLSVVMLQRGNLIAGNDQRRRSAKGKNCYEWGMLLIFDTLASQKSFHEQREMLPWNTAVLSGLCDDTAMLGEFDSQVGLRKVFERSLLRIHVWKDGQSRID